MAKLFYIRERHNPQMKNPYYVAHGQMTKKEAKNWEKPIYGDNYMQSFVSEQEYNEAIEVIKKEGFSVKNEN